MDCQEARRLLHAYVDGELDLVRQMEIETHLKACRACTAAYEEHRALQSALRGAGLRYRTPAQLEARVRAAVGAARTHAPREMPRRVVWGSPLGWLAAAAAIVLVVFLGWKILPSWRPGNEQLASEVVAGHVRSLLASHLLDVPSTDQHTVKPWFAGKLDFSPPVGDFKEQGFELVGGRLDYLDGRAIAALVYRRRQHTINLFVWPAQTSAQEDEEASSRQGYNLIHWKQAGMNFWAVSDLNAAELAQFAGLVRAGPRPPAAR